MGKTIKREACDLCNSKDNLCTYIGTNGNEYTKCVTPGCLNANNVQSVLSDSEFKLNQACKDISFISDEEYDALNGENSWVMTTTTDRLVYRGISPEIQKQLGIISNYDDNNLIASYEHTNLDKTVDIKYRWQDKKFSWAQPKGDNTTPFGLDKCIDFNKPLYITEGNEDCASLWEIGRQACSVLSADSKNNDLVKAVNYVNQFKEIIIAVDNDQAGQTVRDNIKKLFPTKLVKELNFEPYKDANEALVTERDFLINIVEEIEEMLPDGLIQGNQLDFNKLKHQVIKAIPLPWPKLQDALQGLEYGCLYLFLAGTSTGKSTVLRELAYHYRKTLPDLKIANFFFEENEQVTPLAYLALHLNLPLGDLRRTINELDENVYTKAYNEVLDNDKLMFINKDFSKNIDNLLKTIEYLVINKGYSLIIIDHISYIIGRTGTSRNGERIDIDNFIYRLQDITQRLGCIILAVSHVNESDSTKRWDQGQAPNIYSGRGSKALAQVPDGIIGLARNIESEFDKSTLTLYNLKNRWFGQTGKVDELVYIEKTGRLVLK